MASYTYECEDCGHTINFNSPQEAPFNKPHLTPMPDGYDCVEEHCNGLFYRDWKATEFTMKGKGGYETDSPYD